VRLNFEPDEFWEKRLGDARIVRNPQKIKAVRENARFVAEIAREHGSFGQFLAAWPAEDESDCLRCSASAARALADARAVFSALRWLGRVHAVEGYGCLPSRCRAGHP
jgi:3-methyladenine DNA glycosylase Tag